MFGWFKRKETSPAIVPSRQKLSASDQEMVRIANAAVTAYDDYLEQNPIGHEIRDVSQLPGPKKALVNAIRVELMFEQDERVRAFLIEIGLKLALFRDGIGPKEIAFFGLPIEQLDPKSLSDEQMLDRILVAGSHPDRARHEALMPQVQTEWRELAELFDKSVAIAILRRDGSIRPTRNPLAD